MDPALPAGAPARKPGQKFAQVQKPAPSVLLYGDQSQVAPGQYNAWAEPAHAPGEMLCAARDDTPGEAFARVCEMLAEDFRKAAPPGGAAREREGGRG